MLAMSALQNTVCTTALVGCKLADSYGDCLLPITSVVTVSKILPSVGFGRFCKKNRGFRFGLGSHNKRIVNVEAASDAVIFSHVVLRLLTMHIDIISVNQYRLKMTYLV